MPHVRVNGIRIHYEEQGQGAPIACIHGTSSSALVWGDAITELARLGRVIAYDRRGCTRSERPEPYVRTSVSEHANDAAALLDALAATPAVVIGRSYGGGVAIDLALRYPDRVRALVLLEAADLTGLSPAMDRWGKELAGRLSEVAAESGVNAAGMAFMKEVLGEDTWNSLPGETRRMFVDNSPAIIAETAGETLEVDAGMLARIEQPALLVAGRDSAPEFRELTQAISNALPNARVSSTQGGHLIDPATPEVLAFVEETLASDR